MPQYTQNYSYAEPQYGESADIEVLNRYVTTKVDENIYQTRRMSVNGYDEDETYNTGDLVEYSNALYRCLDNNVTGTWDATKWELTTLADELATKGSGGADVTKTASGNPIEITDGADAPLVKCVTEIQGSQDLHGQDKPWVGGANINKMPPGEAKTETVNGVTCTSDGNGKYTFNGTPTGSVQFVIPVDEFTILDDANSAVYFFNSFSLSSLTFMFFYNNDVVETWSLQSINRVSTYTAMMGRQCNKIMITFGVGTPIVDGVIMPMLAVGTSYTAWTPYSNICPITAYTEGEIEVSDGDGNTTTHTTTYPSAIYRGSEDVVNRTATMEWIKVVFDGSSDEGWTIATSDTTAFFFCSRADVPTPNWSDILCDSFKTVKTASERGIEGTIWIVYQQIHIHATSAIAPSGVTSEGLEEFKTWLSNNPIEVAYPVKTPTTTPVTPTNLPIKSLSGYNHIESSTGDMEIEYITQEFQPIVDLIESNSGKVTQDILYTASTMSETEIDVDLTAYDEYIFFANDVLATTQIPQGNSLPKAVVEYMISNNPTLALYGYDDCSCIYTVTSSKLTYSSGRGGYKITMIVGIKNGNVTRNVQTRSLNLSKGETSDEKKEVEEEPIEEKKSLKSEITEEETKPEEEENED